MQWHKVFIGIAGVIGAAWLKRKGWPLVLVGAVLVISGIVLYTADKPDMSLAASTRVNTVSSNGGGYTNGYNLSMGTVAAGDLVVLALSYDTTGTVSSVTDNQSNVWNLIATGGTAQKGSLYYATTTSAGSLTITLAFTDYYDVPSVARVYSGIEADALDVYASNVESGYDVSHPSGTTGTPTQDTELVVAMYAGDANANYTVGGSFGNLLRQNGSDLYSSVVIADLDQTSAAAQSATFDSGATYMQGFGAIATFKEAAAGDPTPTPPVIEAGDITESGNNTASASWAVSHPAASTGDLLIFNIGWDDSTNVTGLTPPSGPNGETAVVIENVAGDSGTAVRGKVVYYVATGAWSASTITFTPSASEQWTAAVIRVPAGEFDSTTPVGAHNSLGSSSTGNPSTPAVTAGSTDGYGRLVAFIVGDVDDPDSGATGWTTRTSTDRGAVGANIDTRDAATTDSESIASASGWTFPLARAWVSFAYIVRPAPLASGGASSTAQSVFFF